MKNTGIVRKIDELGRIVIPKEIRNILKINSGDDLEILAEDNKIYLQKYSVLENSKKESNKLLTSISNLIDAYIFITDKEKVITKGLLENKEIDEKLKTLIYEREKYISKEKEVFNFDNEKVTGHFIIMPIIKSSDAIGLVVILKDTNINKEDILFASIVKNIEESK